MSNAQQTRLEEMEKEASLISTIPSVLPEFVPFGDYSVVERIVASNQFMPVYITGESGIGKTLFVEQACAATGREYVRLNITQETDEDDLLGGLRLRNGETYVEVGPAVVTMLRGGVLMLDELDLASTKIMCLQPLLEGKPVTLKKLGMIIKPKKGFTVFATANTKGRGDENGRYIGTGQMNEALLERFPLTIEQRYPNPSDEYNILVKTFEQTGGKMDNTSKIFFETLTKWAEGIRKAYAELSIDDVLSTRRLTHIVRAYHMFGANQQAQGFALAFCINRFDEASRAAFISMYNMLTPTAANTNTGKKGSSIPKF